MPEDSLYLPLHVGAEGKIDENGNPLDLGYVKDNTGDNISSRNPSFCELTGLYWAWKNLDADYIGLVHYRRYFSYKRKNSDPFDNILTTPEAEELLKKYDVIVPSKRHYYIETLYSHYAHTHYASHLDETRKIIEEIYPEYLTYYDKTVRQTWGYMFNMMLMDRHKLDAYCEWLFRILFELEDRINNKKIADSDDLSGYQGRIYGFISEILFNVWLTHELEAGRITKIKELRCINMEKIDWNRKIRSFLKAKFLGKKYDGSF